MFAPGSSFGIISGDKPRYTGELSHLGHEGLKAQLQLLGLKHDETTGNYDGPERAVVVYNPSREQMYELGRKFGQESVIWGHNHKGHPGTHSELLYTNGAHAGKAHLPVEHMPHVEHFKTAPENYFTHVPGAKDGSAFRLNYDMDKLHPVPLNVGSRHPQALAPADNGRPDLTKNLADAASRRPLRLHPHAYPWHDGHTQHNSLHATPGAVLVRKNDGGRTDKGLMWDPAESQKGSFAKGAITEPDLGLQPFKGSIAAGIRKDDGCNSAGDMGVPDPRGSFAHMANTRGHHEDGGLGKDEPHPGEGAKPFQNDQAPGVGKAPEYEHFAAPYGNIDHENPQELRHYHYEGRLGDVQRQVRDHGFQTYLAGGRHGKPDLANKNYNTGHLMIYDPEAGSGGDFGDSGYTHAWRAQHELAHALTYPEVNRLYGEGRRIGKLGTHRTVNEAKRAVHWEWLAGHKQRELAGQLGIHVNDADFHREMNTIMHDAAHRAVTGKFTEPGAEGFRPHQHLVPLETALGLVHEHARRLGLQDPHSILHKSLETALQTFTGETNRIKRIMTQHDTGKGYGHAGDAEQCYNHIAQKFNSKKNAISQLMAAGHTPETNPELKHHISLMHWMGEFLANRKTPLRDPEPPGQAAAAPQSMYGGGYAPWGRAITGMANKKSESGPQSTTLATEQRSMANDNSADHKVYTPEQARLILAKALTERISGYADVLATLQKRETGTLEKWEPEEASAIAQRSSKAAHAAGTPRAHYDAAATHSEASTINARAGNIKQAKIHDAASNQHRQLAGHYKSEGLEKVAPPGREEQVRALKPKVGTASAFKIAWASYNHGKETKKNMMGGSENVSSGTPGLMMAERPETVHPQNSPEDKKFRADNARATEAGKKGISVKPGDGVAKSSAPTGHDAMPNPPSSMNLNEPQPNNLREKQAVPVKTDDPRSNSFVTAGNNQKSEKDAGGKTAGRTNTLRPTDPRGGTLSGDKVSPEISHGDASGNIHPSPLEPGGKAPSNKVAEAPIRKDDVPMAKPPSGGSGVAPKPPAQSKPSAGGMKTPKMGGGAVGGLKMAMSKAFDIGSKKAGALQGAHAAAPAAAPAAAAPKMPTPGEHEQRAAGFQAAMPAGKFAPAGGAPAATPGAAPKPAAAGAPAAVAKPAGPPAPAPAAKPAAPVGGIKAPSSGSLPVSSASAFGAKPKPMGTGASMHLPKLKAVFGRQGGQQQLQRSEKSKK